VAESQRAANRGVRLGPSFGLTFRKGAPQQLPRDTDDLSLRRTRACRTDRTANAGPRLPLSEALACFASRSCSSIVIACNTGDERRRLEKSLRVAGPNPIGVVRPLCRSRGLRVGSARDRGARRRDRNGSASGATARAVRYLDPLAAFIPTSSGRPKLVHDRRAP